MFVVPLDSRIARYVRPRQWFPAPCACRACCLSSLAAHSLRLPCQAYVLAERQREIGEVLPVLAALHRTCPSV
jgi:hypothetical protein